MRLHLSTRSIFKYMRVELCWKLQEISLSLDFDAKCSFQEFTPVYSNLLSGSVPAQPIPAERSSREEIGGFPE